MSKIMYRIKSLSTEEDARRISEFLLSEDSFDDTNHTPGERKLFSEKPYEALEGHYQIRFIENEQGRIIGVSSYVENEQQTGGYYWDYIAVHKNCRNQRLASMFVGEMMEYLKGEGARYLMTYTCSLDHYSSIRHLFNRIGFREIGRIPDYYFDGEDRLVYYLKL